MKNKQIGNRVQCDKVVIDKCQFSHDEEESLTNLSQHAKEEISTSCIFLDEIFVDSKHKLHVFESKQVKKNVKTITKRY